MNARQALQQAWMRRCLFPFADRVSLGDIDALLQPSCWSLGTEWKCRGAACAHPTLDTRYPRCLSPIHDT